MASSTKSLSKESSAKHSLPFDMDQWVIDIRTTIEEEIEEEDRKTTVSIFAVPSALMGCKPEAYMPQLFAFGPYHQWTPHLYDMERYKLEAARRTHARLISNGHKFDEIVEQFMKHEYKIRCHYHKYLSLSAKTLAWMMAIDVSFLLEFLEYYTKQQAEDALQEQSAKTPSKRIESERRKIGFNLILRDLTMLENQIPLFLVRKLLKLIHSNSKEKAEEELTSMLVEFIHDVSPFKPVGDHDSEQQLLIDNITRHSHLLEILYWSIVPKPKAVVEIDITDGNGEDDHSNKEVDLGDTSTVRKVFNWIAGCLSSINGGPVLRFLKGLLFSRPIKLIFQFPWKVITALPIISLIKEPVEGLVSSFLPTKPKSDDDNNSSQPDKPPLADEITIPSVSDLFAIGVKFLPTDTTDLTAIKFDTKTRTLYLPIIHLDVNSEVVLRNLVAYEASVVQGPLVFTRYTELMNGIIDTDEDVRILMNQGIVVNRLKSNNEAAEMWNGMSKSLKLSKVGFLDQAIGDVNKCYGKSWRVKGKKFVTEYIFASWKVLTLLAALLLLAMTCIQSFCTVYNCNSHLKNITTAATGTTAA